MAPRRHDRAREPSAPFVPRPSPSAAPAWAAAAGVEVRAVTGEKPYRCPGCEGVIPPGTPHLVVVPLDVPDERRHWHTPCWRRELNRTRR
ncbi:MAG: hypothetical protein LC722_05940 [Actinobacteria bacterium]|nr:hypothetical protein [Actinomycetota bacterium]